MDQEPLRQWAGPVIAFLASTIVIPAGLAAVGLSWRLIFAVSLFATVGVAVWGFPQWRTVSGVALLLAGAFAVWAAMHEHGYKLTYQFCRSHRLELVRGKYRLTRFQLGARLFNESGSDLWGRVVEESWTLGEQASKRRGSDAPFRFFNGARNLVVANGVDLSPPVLTDEIPRGHIRYVIKYGKKEDAMGKTLIVSYYFDVQVLPDGDTAINFHPDPDTQHPVTDDLCRLPP